MWEISGSCLLGYSGEGGFCSTTVPSYIVEYLYLFVILKVLGSSILSASNHSTIILTDPQAKIQVTIGDKVVGRLRTKRKSESCSPIFNEALTCTIDPSSVQKAVITVCVSNEHRSATKRELGSISLSSQGTGEEFRHWNDVLAQLGKHIAEWHELRQR